LNVRTAHEVATYLDNLGCLDVKRFVGGDPGKGVLLALVDEFRKKLVYTSGQRKHETDGGIRRLRERTKTSKSGRKPTVKRGHKTSKAIRDRASKRRLKVDEVTSPSCDGTNKTLPLRDPQGTGSGYETERSDPQDGEFGRLAKICSHSRGVQCRFRNRVLATSLPRDEVHRLDEA